MKATRREIMRVGALGALGAIAASIAGKVGIVMAVTPGAGEAIDPAVMRVTWERFLELKASANTVEGDIVIDRWNTNKHFGLVWPLDFPYPNWATTTEPILIPTDITDTGTVKQPHRQVWYDWQAGALEPTVSYSSITDGPPA